MTAADISCDPASMERDLDAPADPRDASTWLGRRSLWWGASEIPLLYAAQGWLSAEALTVAQREELESCKRGKGRGLARYIARKAGLAKAKRGESQEAILRKELQLLDVWRRVYAEEHCIDPASVLHCSEMPREWFPLRDAECYALGATPDAIGRDFISGELVGIELKCPPDREAWSRWGLRWSVQCHAQNAVCRFARTLLVCGEQWAIPDRDGPVTTNVIERDESEMSRCREAATDAMATVEELLRERS
jgi:hypothetical protein